jgi:hypothetical protein
MELIQIIQELQKAKKETGLFLKDDVLFENAVDIFISDRINESKSKKFEPFNSKFSKLDNELPISEQTITKGQKFFLDNKGIKTEGLTKLEAMKMIKEIKKEGDNGKRGTKYQ